jgi:hypothetical protein
MRCCCCVLQQHSHVAHVGVAERLGCKGQSRWRRLAPCALARQHVRAPDTPSPDTSSMTPLQAERLEVPAGQGAGEIKKVDEGHEHATFQFGGGRAGASR